MNVPHQQIREREGGIAYWKVTHSLIQTIFNNAIFMGGERRAIAFSKIKIEEMQKKKNIKYPQK